MTYTILDSSPLARPEDLAVAFKAAMRRLAATVTIVTSSGDGRPVGMTATAVTSLCTEPPALLVCINRSASIHPSLRVGGRFCINVLGQTHGDLSMDFGGKVEPENRFNSAGWAFDDNGLPYLADAEANLFCTVDRLIDYGTHSIVIGLVQAASSRRTGHPLVYGDGTFLAFGAGL